MAEQANLATTNDAAEEERPGKLATVEIASARAAQEVQAMVLMAKRFPRDENAAFHRILQACRRKRLADNALYAYPRAGTTISGPTIRMAEVLARSWGNIDFGMVELEQRPGESTMLSYAWDVETNARQTRIFTVKHERHVGKGGQKRIEKLFDPRDIYEMCANMGARRLRACILGIIPNDIVEAAVEECDKTMAGGNKEPLTDRIRTMVDHFASKYGVAKEHIEGASATKSRCAARRRWCSCERSPKPFKRAWPTGNRSSLLSPRAATSNQRTPVNPGGGLVKNLRRNHLPRLLPTPWKPKTSRPHFHPNRKPQRPRRPALLARTCESGLLTRCT